MPKATPGALIAAGRLGRREWGQSAPRLRLAGSKAMAPRAAAAQASLARRSRRASSQTPGSLRLGCGLANLERLAAKAQKSALTLLRDASKFCTFGQ